MMTRSIAGRFLILAVLLVSLGVIAQAALVITKDSGKKVVASTASTVPVAPSAPAVATLPPPASPPADARPTPPTAGARSPCWSRR